jgi:hypothetical protein
MVSFMKEVPATLSIAVHNSQALLSHNNYNNYNNVYTSRLDYRGLDARCG